MKKKRVIKFYVGDVIAILAWFSYSSIDGVDMLNFTKSHSFHAKGNEHQLKYGTGYHK